MFTKMNKRWNYQQHPSTYPLTTPTATKMHLPRLHLNRQLTKKTKTVPMKESADQIRQQADTLDAKTKALVTYLSKLQDSNICTLPFQSQQAKQCAITERACDGSKFEQHIRSLHNVLHKCTDTGVQCTAVIILSDQSNFKTITDNVCGAVAQLLFTSQKLVAHPPKEQLPNQTKCNILLSETLLETARTLIKKINGYIKLCCDTATCLGCTTLEGYQSQLDECVTKTIRQMTGKDLIELKMPVDDLRLYLFGSA